ncbi:MAG: hypothetical protein ACYC6K_13080 [Bellilinea sp.]
MTPPYQVKKVSDEGSSSPFISRIFMGILFFRDQLFLIDTDGQQRRASLNYFDQQFKPMYEAAQATRDAAIRVCELVDSHRSAIQNGNLIQFRANQYDILETIDKPLSQAVDLLIDQTIIATKTGLQKILKDPLNLDIGFFFQKDKDFHEGLKNLRALGENDLAQYLQDVRVNWHSKLQELRTEHEHGGWSLDSIEYELTAPYTVKINLPTVLSMPVNEFVLKTANRVLFFIENMMVYAMLRYSHQSPIFVVEIPIESRNPPNPKRFRLAPKGLDGSTPWVITYQDAREFV